MKFQYKYKYKKTLRRLNTLTISCATVPAATNQFLLLIYFQFTNALYVLSDKHTLLIWFFNMSQTPSLSKLIEFILACNNEACSQFTQLSFMYPCFTSSYLDWTLVNIAISSKRFVFKLKDCFLFETNYMVPYDFFNLQVSTIS